MRRAMVLLRLRVFHGICSSSLRVLCLSLLSFRILQSLQDRLLVYFFLPLKHSVVQSIRLCIGSLKNFFLTLAAAVVCVVISALRCGLKGGLLSRDPDQSQINR